MCISQVVRKGEQGKRVLFILPGVLFVVAMVVFPLIFATTNKTPGNMNNTRLPCSPLRTTCEMHRQVAQNR